MPRAFPNRLFVFAAFSLAVAFAARAQGPVLVVQPSAAETPASRVWNSGMVLPRIATSSSPSLVASASPLALSASAITSTRPDSSGTSA